MKSMKGKLLKKLKTIKSIGYLKPERILHVNAADGYFEASLPQTQKIFADKDSIFIRQDQKPEIIDVSELMRDLEDDEFDENENIEPKSDDKIRGFSSESDDEFNEKENTRLETGDKNRVIWVSVEEDEIYSEDELNEKENIRPKIKDKNRGFSEFSKPEKENLETLGSGFREKRIDPLAELDVANFQPPDFDSNTLFDPNLLAAFEQAVIEFKAQEDERRAKIKEQEKYQELIEEPPLKAQKIDENRDPFFENRDPLLDFDEKCPPGGSDSVILYTTSLRSIRRTFEDCHKVRFLLENFRILYFERDISMHSEFKEELWRIMGEKIIPPCLFIKGRFIGRADRVLGLHEQGKLRALFDGLPIDRAEGPCDGCGGARFIVCFNCNGSRKVVVDDDVVVAESCEDCNENGLIICPICC